MGIRIFKINNIGINKSSSPVAVAIAANATLRVGGILTFTNGQISRTGTSAHIGSSKTDANGKTGELTTVKLGL